MQAFRFHSLNLTTCFRSVALKLSDIVHSGGIRQRVKFQIDRLRIAIVNAFLLTCLKPTVFKFLRKSVICAFSK